MQRDSCRSSGCKYTTVAACLEFCCSRGAGFLFERACLLAYRVLTGTASRYIRELLQPVADVDSRSHLRSASNGDLVVPSTRLKTGERAFSIAAPQAWNRLQVEPKTMILERTENSHVLEITYCYNQNF